MKSFLILYMVSVFSLGLVPRAGRQIKPAVNQLNREYEGLSRNTVQELHQPDTIHWRPDYRLRWSDFKGSPNRSSHSSAVSNILVRYELEYSKKGFKTAVYCYFNRDSSWTISRDSTLLAHEQTHFDIAELYARKLRQKFKEYKFNYATVEQDLKRIRLQVMAEKKAFNDRYEMETFSSMDTAKQREWTENVRSLLKK